MTFNIAHGRGLSLYQGFQSAAKIEKNLQKIADLLRDKKVDVVALQEVDELSHWTKGVNLLDYLQEASGFSYSLMGVHRRREHPKRHLAYGNAILSRFPISTSENQPFVSDAKGGKGFLYAEIDYEESILPIINVHLDYRSRARRLEQVEELIDFLKKREHPGEKAPLRPVICGDFNSRAGVTRDAVAYLFSYILSHGPYNLFPNKVGTFPAYLPQKRLSRGIDFIFLPSVYQLVNCEVIQAYLSDHRPVLVETTASS